MSEITYYGLNIGLAGALLGLTLVAQSPIPALVLVFLSKWRVLAVRPRYWWTNIQSNMVDMIVGLSIVALLYLYLSSGWFWVQVGLAVVYAIWLTLIKPLSRRWQMTMQAVIAVAIGSLALFSSGYLLPNAAVVMLAMVLGYSAARHVLHGYEEDQTVFLSAIWGVIFAEVAWLLQRWTVAYAIPGLPVLKVPQATIVLLLLTFVGERLYRMMRTRGSVATADILPPAFFAVAVIVAMLLFANSVRI